MTYEELGNRNLSEGFHVIFVYANDVTSGLLFRSVLLMFWILIGLGGYFAEKRITGNARFVNYFATASLLTSFAAIIATATIPGLNDITAVIVSIAITAIGLIWLFVSD